MSENCQDALNCRPEDLQYALSIHTQKITDSCRDKDCIEDLRVWLTQEGQTILDTAASAKVRVNSCMTKLVITRFLFRV